MVIVSDLGVANNYYYCDAHWLSLNRKLRQARALSLVLKVVTV